MRLVTEDDERKEFRYGVPAEMYADWRAAHKRIGLPQTQMLHRLVKFLLAQDQVTQMMILGQLEPRPDLLEFVLRQRAPLPNPRDARAYGGRGHHGFNSEDADGTGGAPKKPKK
jgi:hypothetical protein